MRLITTFELAIRNKSELHVLFRQATEAAVRSERNSAERRNALASLENIVRAMRIDKPPTP